MSKTYIVWLLFLAPTISYSQVTKPSTYSGPKKSAVKHLPNAAFPVKKWIWGYSGREVRRQILTEVGWFPSQPADSCAFCLSFTDGFECFIEFAFKPDGLWRCKWEIPRDHPNIKSWENWYNKTSPPTFSGAEKYLRSVDGAGDYSTFVWREECGDFIVYTAVAQDRGGTPGPGIFGRELKDCKDNIYR